MGTIPVPPPRPVLTALNLEVFFDAVRQTVRSDPEVRQRLSRIAVSGGLLNVVQPGDGEPVRQVGAVVVRVPFDDVQSLLPARMVGLEAEAAGRITFELTENLRPLVPEPFFEVEGKNLPLREVLSSCTFFGQFVLVLVPVDLDCSSAKGFKAHGDGDELTCWYSFGLSPELNPTVPTGRNVLYCEQLSEGDAVRDPSFFVEARQMSAASEIRDVLRPVPEAINKLRRCDGPGCVKVEASRSAQPPPEITAQLKSCKACSSVLYCSPECQLAHWRAGHKKECANLAKAMAARVKSGDAAGVLTHLKGM